MITFIIVSPSFFPAVTLFRIPRTADHVLANTAGASTSKHRPRPRAKQDGIPQGPDGFWRCHDTQDTIHSEPMQVDLPCDVPPPLRCVLVRATLWVMCQQLRCQQRSSRIGVDQPWVAVKINHKNPGFCFNWPKWWTVGQTSKKESTKRKLALIRTCYKLNAAQINIECLLRNMIFATSYPHTCSTKSGGARSHHRAGIFHAPGQCLSLFHLSYVSIEKWKTKAFTSDSPEISTIFSAMYCNPINSSPEEMIHIVSGIGSIVGLAETRIQHLECNTLKQPSSSSLY